MEETFTQIKTHLDETIQWLRNEYAQMHTGRATPGILDGIQVVAYGTAMPIKNIASVNIEDPKTLRVGPYDKGQIKDIERAITDADLGLSVSIDDGGLRVHFPKLTEETRLKLVKVLKEKLEDARVAVRSERKDAIQHLEKKESDGDISEDILERKKEELQRMVDEANETLETLFKKKETEVTTV